MITLCNYLALCAVLRPWGYWEGLQALRGPET